MYEPIIYDVICPVCNTVVEVEEDTIVECFNCGTELDNSGNVM